MGHPKPPSRPRPRLALRANRFAGHANRMASGRKATLTRLRCHATVLAAFIANENGTSGGALCWRLRWGRAVPAPARADRRIWQDRPAVPWAFVFGALALRSS